MSEEAAKEAVAFVQFNSRQELRPNQPWHTLPASHIQIRPIQDAARQRRHTVVHWYAARRTKLMSPLAQPALMRAIRHARDIDGWLYVADVLRLVQSLPLKRAIEALDELGNLGLPIFSVAHRAPLSRLEPILREVLVMQARRDQIERSARIRLGLKRRGENEKLGTESTLRWARDKAVRVVRSKADQFALQLGPTIEDIRAMLPPQERDCHTAISRVLNARNIPTRRGGKWSDVQVRRVRERFEQLKDQSQAAAE